MEKMKKNKPNIIFIVVDAFRPSNLGCYGYERGTSPHIDKIAKDGVLFENCYACSTSTDPSFTSMFSGKYPTSHGIIHHGPKVTKVEEDRFYKSNIKMLAEVLKANGYTTIGMDWLGRWHKIGFDYYWSEEEGRLTNVKESPLNKIVKSLPMPIHNLLMKIVRKRRMFLPDHEGGNLTKVAIEKMKESKKPFFVMMHYWDAHTPFRVPIEYYEKFNTQPKKTKINDLLKKIKKKEWRDYIHKSTVGSMFDYVEEFAAMYDGAINYVDFQIGKIIEFLKDGGLDDDTLLIITGDHGAALGEHPPFFDHHGFYEEIVRVPLIMRYGNRLPKKRVREMTQHVDLVPTILELLGIESKVYGPEGHVLDAVTGGTKSGRKYVYITDSHAYRFAVFDGRHKYIYSKNEANAKCCYCDEIHEGEREVLYDIKVDPSESKNVLAEKSEVASRLKKELFGWLANGRVSDMKLHI
jgi:arylsulfatase